MSKPEPNFKKVIFRNRQEILKTSLERKALNTERTKRTNGTWVEGYFYVRNEVAVEWHVFCNNHQTLLLDVNI